MLFFSLLAVFSHTGFSISSPLSTVERESSSQGLVRRLEYQRCTPQQEQRIQQTLPLIRDLMTLGDFILASGEGFATHEIFTKYFQIDSEHYRSRVMRYLAAADVEARLGIQRDSTLERGHPPVTVHCSPREPDERCTRRRNAFVEYRGAGGRPLRRQYIVLVGLIFVRVHALVTGCNMSLSKANRAYVLPLPVPELLGP